MGLEDGGRVGPAGSADRGEEGVGDLADADRSYARGPKALQGLNIEREVSDDAFDAIMDQQLAEV